MSSLTFVLRRSNLLFAIYRSNITTCDHHCRHRPSCSNVLGGVKLYSSHTFDLAIVGGGIVGAAVARELSARFSNLSIALVEKEDELAAHQSGHNSGVIHAGIYYAEGSLKAKLCVAGSKRVYSYCDERGIPYKKVGKLIVATDEEECTTLNNLYNRASKNGVQGIKMVNGAEAAEIEPAVLAQSCKSAIWSPMTGIVDWALVTTKYVEETLSANSRSKLFLGFNLQSMSWDESKKVVLLKGCRRSISPSSVNFLTVQNPLVSINSSSLDSNYSNSTIQAKFVVTAGGLWSDHLARMTQCPVNPVVVPFRGEFLLLKKGSLAIRTNIYPVPDVNFPFLGVHVTPRMDGSIWIGPNAVFAFSRTGYKLTNVNLSDLFTSLAHPGFRKLALTHWRKGLSEFYSSIFPSSALKDIQKLVPTITLDSLAKGKQSGVRAQALTPDGLFDDFCFDEPPQGTSFSGRVIHVRNAPSPAATSSLSIGDVIADRVIHMMNKSLQE